MSDKVPTIMYWEGVPITDLSRHELEAALRSMHHQLETVIADNVRRMRPLKDWGKG